MIMENTPPELITIEEAIRIIYPNQTLGDMLRAKKIFEAFNLVMPTDTNYKWRLTRLLAAVYSVGRIQGIREERIKRK